MFRVRWWIVGLCALAAAYAVEARAAGGACTIGVDCYCDCIKQNPPSGTCAAKYPGIFYDPSAHCADFEKLAYHDDTGGGAGGAWYAVKPGDPADNRGSGSAFHEDFKGISGQCGWQYGHPNNGACSGPYTPYKCCGASPPGTAACPQRGASCGAGKVCWASEWRADDLWDGNFKAGIDILRAGEVDDENPTDALEAGWDGQQFFALRVRPGEGGGGDSDAGCNVGDANDWVFGQEFGVTYLIAYSDLADAYSAGELANPLCWDPTNEFFTGKQSLTQWKHEQFVLPIQFPQGNVGPGNAVPPFGMAFINAGLSTEAECNAERTAATINKGSMSCSDIALNVGATGGSGPDLFRYPDDWGKEKWACVRAYLNMGTFGNRDGSMWVEVEAPGFSSTAKGRLIDITNLGLNKLMGTSTLGNWHFDSYFNGNGFQPDCELQHAIRRYYDNIHARPGQPVSCAQIGFGAAAPPPNYIYAPVWSTP